MSRTNNPKPNRVFHRWGILWASSSEGIQVIFLFGDENGVCERSPPVYLTISFTNHNHLLFTTIRLVRSPIVWGFRPELEFSIKRWCFCNLMNFPFYLGTHWRNGSSWISLYLFVKHISWQSFVNSLLGLIKTIDNYKIIQKQWKPNWPLYIKLLVLLSCVNQRTGELDPSLESFWDFNLFSSLLLSLVSNPYIWFSLSFAIGHLGSALDDSRPPDSNSW